jgi:uncharacterized coiled-coil DUF342 family protein
MTEEQTPTEEPQKGDQLVDELQSLGQQLVTAVKALWDSEDSRKLRQEIGDGFVELGHQLDEAIKSAQESEAAQEFKESVKETVDKARESDVAGKVQQNLVTGLQKLNAELGKVVDSLEETGEAGEAPEDEPAA